MENQNNNEHDSSDYLTETPEEKERRFKATIKGLTANLKRDKLTKPLDKVSQLLAMLSPIPKSIPEARNAAASTVSLEEIHAQFSKIVKVISWHLEEESVRGVTRGFIKIPSNGKIETIFQIVHNQIEGMIILFEKASCQES